MYLIRLAMDPAATPAVSFRESGTLFEHEQLKRVELEAAFASCQQDQAMIEDIFTYLSMLFYSTLPFNGCQVLALTADRC
jgi:hypothetical protein